LCRICGRFPLNRAGILLEENEFKKGRVSFTYSSSTEKDSIIAQYPDPFSTAVKGRSCDLLVSRGEKPLGIVMPDIRGLRLEVAAGTLKTLRLDISDIVSDRDPLKEIGVVLSLTPEAGSRVTKDTPITLVVNNPEKNQHMSPDALNRSVFLTHSLEPGFLKRHVRVETDMLGPALDLYDEYMKPGQDIRVLVVPGIRARVSFYVDHTLVKTIHIDPWKADNTDNTIGDPLLWESSPLQFYHPTSPDWEES
jgi:serine/threonine-protein kinase